MLTGDVPKGHSRGPVNFGVLYRFGISKKKLVEFGRIWSNWPEGWRPGSGAGISSNVFLYCFIFSLAPKSNAFYSLHFRFPYVFMTGGAHCPLLTAEVSKCSSRRQLKSFDGRNLRRIDSVNDLSKRWARTLDQAVTRIAEFTPISIPSRSC